MANLDGVMLIDKAPDMTSFQVVKVMKRLFNTSKVGHTGTLDPIATGMLPICFGRATKTANIIMTYRKEYDVWARFGVATDSHDRTGQTIDEKPWVHLSRESVLEAMKGFIGEIKQDPPMFSAVKYQGRPLYWYAHQGIVISPRKERSCTIDSFELTEWAPPRARFLIRSSHGTYVRSLVHDLAIRLGSAAMVDELRRNACGDFRVEQATTLAKLDAQSFEERQTQVLSMNDSLPHLPNYAVNQNLAERVRAGRTIMWSDIKSSAQDAEAKLAEAELFKLTAPSGELVAIASWGDWNQDKPATPVPMLTNRVVRTLRIFA